MLELMDKPNLNSKKTYYNVESMSSFQPNNFDLRMNSDLGRSHGPIAERPISSVILVWAGLSSLAPRDPTMPSPEALRTTPQLRQRSGGQPRPVSHQC